MDHVVELCTEMDPSQQSFKLKNLITLKEALVSGFRHVEEFLWASYANYGPRKLKEMTKSNLAGEAEELNE